MATLVLGAAATALSGSIGASPLVSALISGAAAVGGAYADGLLAGALSPTQRGARASAICGCRPQPKARPFRMPLAGCG